MRLFIQLFSLFGAGTEEAEDEVEQLRRQLQQLNRQRDELQDERDALEQRVKKLEAQLDSKNRRLRDIEGSLAELQGLVEANAEGDLTRRINIESDTEAVVAFISTYNRMLDEWNETLQRVKSFGAEVQQATTTTEQEITQLQEDSEQATQSVTNIVEGTDIQKEQLDEISAEMTRLSGTIEEISARAERVAEMSTQAVEDGERSQEAATKAIERLEQMSTETTETMAQIEQLQSQVRNIEEITSFISDVAEQTDMLALNANIEAARHQTEGGFEVVAEEIKELATETKGATDRIEQLATEIRDETDEAVSNMEATNSAVMDTKTAVMDALNGLDEVVESVDDVNQSIAEVTDATDKQARSTQEVSNRIDDVAEISRETTTQAHEARDAAENQTTALTAVDSEMADLSTRADALYQTTEEFTTGERRRRTIDESDTTIRFHHAMGGARALLLQDLATEFEQQTEGIRITPISMGSYPAALQSVLEVSAEERPALAQVYDIGTATAQSSGCFQPAENLLSSKTSEKIVDSVRGYYEVDNRLHSIPFNSSNPILCYNKTQFEQAGMDSTSPPDTLSQLRRVSETLCNKTDCAYGISFAIYSWFVEQWFGEADHLLVDANNGRSGTPTTAFLDTEFGRELFKWWVKMEQEGLYYNPGVHGHSAALEAFHRGEAGMFLGSTASLDRIKAGADFPLGTAFFPVLNERHGVLVGGASLWVGRDLDPAVESALAEFLRWLLQPEQQARWHRETGYFPVVEGAINRLEANNWFKKNPEFATAFRQFQQSTDTAATNGARIEQFPEIRTHIHEARDQMETVDDVAPILAETNRSINGLLQSED
jgi:sn-glycerol 3-phosphate transport system substrate-binding protein